MTNRGEKIVKEYMRKPRFFVAGTDLRACAKQMAIQAKATQPNGKPDMGVVKQITGCLERLERQGSIRFHKTEDQPVPRVGYRKATADEQARFQRDLHRANGSWQSRVRRRGPARRYSRQQQFA